MPKLFLTTLSSCSSIVRPWVESEHPQLECGWLEQSAAPKLLNNLPERGYSYIQVGRSAYGDSARAPMPGVCKVESELEMWLGWIRRRQPGAKSITASQLDAYSHRDGCRRLEVG